jgi:DNA-binding Xre family transcriptional regulator
MIEIQIKQRAEKQGITTAYQLQKALEVSPDVASRLWNGNFTRVDLSTLDRLCRVLKCQPNVLFKYVAVETES